MREILPAPRVRLPCAENKDDLVYRALAESRVYNFANLDTSFIGNALVRMFYSNLVEVERSNGSAFTTHINGTVIRLDSKIIHDYTYLPCDEQPYRETYNEVEFLSAIGVDVTDMTNRPLDDQISLPFRLLHNVVSNVIHPRDPPHNTITSDDARVMEILLNRRPINWSNFVLAHMQATVENNWSLPYASMIMKILDHYVHTHRYSNYNMNYAMPIGDQSKPRWTDADYMPGWLTRSDSEDSD